MRRIVLLLMILSLTRIAAVYADPNQVNTNVFTGNQVEATTDDGTFSGLFQGVDSTNGNCSLRRLKDGCKYSKRCCFSSAIRA